jgi:chromosome segregation and condensation protein ScpB
MMVLILLTESEPAGATSEELQTLLKEEFKEELSLNRVRQVLRRLHNKADLGVLWSEKDNRYYINRGGHLYMARLIKRFIPQLDVHHVQPFKDDAQRLLSTIKAAVQPLSAGELSALAGISKSRCEKLLDYLDSQELVEQVEREGNPAWQQAAPPHYS